MNDSTIQLHHLRQDYKSASLLETDVDINPIAQFETWFKEAQNAQILEPNAMTLATADKSGIPSARIVLLKEFNENGFVFFTNYLSTKGKQLLDNPHAALVFFWGELERQVRIQGLATKIEEADSEEYFHLRPKGSQLGAIVSAQSQVIPNRKYLEDHLKSLEAKYNQKSIPKPEHWGGYRVIPHRIEFWQGRSNRLHDRILYEHQKDGQWIISRLAP